MGLDRPRPDHANAKVILLISAHLESGHYFNPHAQRVIDGKANGAKLIVFDTRLSNTATHADHFISPFPGSEAAILLSIANYLIQNNLYNREFVRRWWNWEEYLEQRSEVGGQRSELRPTIAEEVTEHQDSDADSQVRKGGLAPQRGRPAGDPARPPPTFE